MRTCRLCLKDRPVARLLIDSFYTHDPKGEVCDLCVRKPINLERNRARRVEAARQLALATGRRPPKQPKVGPPKRPKFFRTQREEDDWNHLHGAPAPKLCRFANRS
jgi:hypothetical protein